MSRIPTDPDPIWWSVFIGTRTNMTTFLLEQAVDGFLEWDKTAVFEEGFYPLERRVTIWIRATYGDKANADTGDWLALVKAIEERLRHATS